jgi:hypothetical protein
MWKSVEPDRPRMTTKHDASTLGATQLRVQMTPSNTQYLLRIHGKNCYANASQFYVYIYISLSFV